MSSSFEDVHWTSWPSINAGLATWLALGLTCYAYYGGDNVSVVAFSVV